MPIPTGFRKWRFHWFECPACRHRAWQTFANVSAAREPVRMVWRFWCERCGAFATLQRPMMPTVAALLILFLVGPAAFAVIYRLLLSGLRFEWLVLAFGAFWIVSPLILLAITRWAYKYVSQP
jgi:hypothetical protein